MHLPKSLLPALATLCLASCGSNTSSTNDSKKKDTAVAAKATPVAEKEKVFVIKPLKDKDPSSIHEHLRPLIPYKFVFSKSLIKDSLRRQLAEDVVITYTSDTVKLHVKGDLCWIEYVSVGTSRAKKKDGSYIEGPGRGSENSDTMVIR